MKTVQLRYWDACMFLGWLKQESDKLSDCRRIINAAERGDIGIVTSAITLVEVVSLGRRTRMPAEDGEKVRGFFQNEYISLENVSRQIAELAQEIIWTHPDLRWKDAIHIATAIIRKIPTFDTYDKDFSVVNTSLYGMKMVVGRPVFDDGPLFNEVEEPTRVVVDPPLILPKASTEIEPPSATV